MKEFYDKFDLEDKNLDEVLHSHTPYTVILYKSLSKFQSKYNKLPTTKDEKIEFDKIISSMCWDKQDYEEINFKEAKAFQYYAYKDKNTVNFLFKVNYSKSFRNI